MNPIKAGEVAVTIAETAAPEATRAAELAAERLLSESAIGRAVVSASATAEHLAPTLSEEATALLARGSGRIVPDISMQADSRIRPFISLGGSFEPADLAKYLEGSSFKNLGGASSNPAGMAADAADDAYLAKLGYPHLRAALGHSSDADSAGNAGVSTATGHPTGIDWNVGNREWTASEHELALGRAVARKILGIDK